MRTTIEKKSRPIHIKLQVTKGKRNRKIEMSVLGGSAHKYGRPAGKAGSAPKYKPSLGKLSQPLFHPDIVYLGIVNPLSVIF